MSVSEITLSMRRWLQALDGNEGAVDVKCRAGQGTDIADLLPLVRYERMPRYMTGKVCHILSSVSAQHW